MTEKQTARQRCSGCGRSKGTKLQPVLNWHDSGKEALLCARCRAGLIIHDSHILSVKIVPAPQP